MISIIESSSKLFDEGTVTETNNKILANVVTKLYFFFLYLVRFFLPEELKSSVLVQLHSDHLQWKVVMWTCLVELVDLLQ